MTVHANIAQKPKVDISEVYRLIDAGLSQGAVSRQLNCTQSYISRLLKARRNNGNLPAIPTPAHSDAPERISALPVHYDASEVDKLRGSVATLEAFMAAIESQQRPSAPQRTDSASVHQDALQRIHEVLARLDSRLHVVEAAALTPPAPSALPAHQDAPAHHSAPERTEPPTWKSQGQQFAEDTLQRLDRYARESRREKREIIDAALRAYLPTEVGQVVRDA